MTKDLEKRIAQKIYKYQFINRDTTGIINDNANSLIKDLMNYLLEVAIKSIDDIPEKYKPIIDP